jgi:hypothetical protein
VVNLVAGITPDQELVKNYQSKFEECARARKQYEKKWYINLAFYFGKHYVEWTKSSVLSNSSSLVIPRAPAWRVRLISNRIKPIIRKETAKVNKERPQFFVVPSTTDDEDITKARMAEAIAESQLYSKNFEAIKRETIWWNSVTGTGFFKTAFDESSLEIDYFSPTPFHIWVPLLEEGNIQKQPFVIHGMAEHVDNIKSQYGVTLQGDALADTNESMFLHSIGIETSNRDQCYVFKKEFWVKPCPDFPDGAMFVIAANQLLYMVEGIPEIEIDPITGQELKDPEGNPVEKKFLPSNQLGGDNPKSSFPYEHGRYPFSKVSHIPTGKFYGESVIDDLIPLQKEYNRSRSQVTEARNLMSKPQWAVQKGAVDVRKLTAQPGLIIEYTPGFQKPEPVNNPELPSYVFQDQAQLVNDIDYISNQYEVTQGRTPPGVEAASAIAYLQEESDSILSYTIDSLEEAVEDVGYQTIHLAKQFWPEDRLLKIISGQQVYEVMQFKKNSLPDNLDFRVEHGSMTPRSKAAKQAFIMELINNGLIPPIEGLKYLGTNETNRLYEDLLLDTRHAERENFKMKQGMPVDINPFDNHDVHALTHARFMKSQTYETLPDEIKQVILAHYQSHLVTVGRIENAGPNPNSESGDAPVEPAGV